MRRGGLRALATSIALVSATLSATSDARAQTSPASTGKAPEERPRGDTDGLALSGGIGSQYVGLGAQAAYYLQLGRSPFRVAPYVGFGVGPFASKDRADFVPAISAGARGSFGQRNRLVVDLFYAPSATTYLSLHGEAPDLRVEWGPGVAVGYEYMGRQGCFFRADVGIQYTVTVPVFAPKDRLNVALTPLAMGCKLW